MRSISDAMNDALFVLDAHTGDILEINRKTTEMFGYTAEEVRRLHIGDLSSNEPPYTQDDAMRWMGKAMAGVPQMFEWRAKDRQGRIFWVEVNMRRAEIQSQQVILLTVRDITERKRAEDLLRQSEEKFSKIFQTTPLTIVISRLEDAILLDVNPGFVASTGYTSDEAVGRRVVDLRLWAQPAERDRMVEKLRLHGEVLNQEMTFRRKDGAIRTGIYSVRPITIESQPCILFVMHDITERKQAEEALREAHRQLDQMIEFLPDATFVIDHESKVIAWNRAMEEMSGIPKAEMLGKGNYEYAIPFYGERRPILIDLALRCEEEVEKKYDSIRRSGDTLYGEVYCPKSIEAKGPICRVPPLCCGMRREISWERLKVSATSTIASSWSGGSIANY